MNKITSKKITILMLVYTIIILLYHINYFKINTEYAFNTLIFNAFINVLNEYSKVALSFFFLMTGFLFYWNIDYGEDCTIQNQIIPKIKRRTFSLLLPFVMWNVITLLFDVILNNASLRVIDIIIGFSVDPFDGPLWYIFAIILFTLFSPLVFWMKKKNSDNFLYVVIVVWLGTFLAGRYYMFIDTHLTYGYAFSRIIYYLPSYLLGMLIGMYDPELLNSTNRECVIISRIIIAYSVISFALGHNGLLYFVLPILSFYSISNECSIDGKFKSLFDISFLIYAAHRLGIPFCKLIYNKLFGNIAVYGIQGIGIKIISAVIIISGCWIFYILFRKLCPSVLYLLTGGRVKKSGDR